MKKIIVFLSLSACAGSQAFEKQIEEQRAQISQLQQTKKQQDEALVYYKKRVKKLTFRVTQAQAAAIETPKVEEPKTEKTEPATRVICVGVEDTGEEFCLTFLAAE